MLLFQILQHMTVSRRHIPPLAHAAMVLQLRQQLAGRGLSLLLARLREGTERQELLRVLFDLKQIYLGPRV